eukprot:7420314-Pyramimonas_sp.AAC.2
MRRQRGGNEAATGGNVAHPQETHATHEAATRQQRHGHEAAMRQIVGRPIQVVHCETSVLVEAALTNARKQH